jgi:DNA repair exonuclease SbcCD ATPase subunit
MERPSNIHNIYDNRHDNYRVDEIFFIDHHKEKRSEIKQHYEDIKTDLVELSRSLTFTTNLSTEIPVWRHRIEIISPITVNINEDLEHHLRKSILESLKDIRKKDKKDLLKDISDLIKKIETHNRNVVQYRNGLRVLVENRFRAENINLTVDPHTGLYYDAGYSILLNTQLEHIMSFIIHGYNLNELQLPVNLTRSGNGHLIVNDSTVGRFDEAITANIVRIIQEIPLNENIINGLRNLYQSVLNIEKEVRKISAELGSLQFKIERNHYKKLTKCCPKRFFFF